MKKLWNGWVGWNEMKLRREDEKGTYHGIQHDRDYQIVNGDTNSRPSMEQLQWQHRLFRDLRLHPDENHKQHRASDEKTDHPRIRPCNLILAHSGSLERDRNEKSTNKACQ